MRRRDEESFLAFAAARSRSLFRSACVLCSGDQHLAEDLVQETLGRLYARWSRMRHVDNPAAYAQTVLVRTFLTYRRRRSNDELPTSTVPDAAQAAEPDAPLRVTLLGAMGQLSSQDRVVLLLRYWQDRSVEETAEILRIRPGAVRNRSMRALERLRDLLGCELAELVHH
ncbi:RNA polymerase sigma-70 factor (sigma-E family) [Streptacidiphilus sp. MAP12-33]|uniref:SigE family RNA polymerase sigma factor n=1 Tax=Streptacidiphilus sp. MAP12-33 TaxID=3156266 RepID=UPI0035195D13